jgi:hypothetical protein
MTFESLVASALSDPHTGWALGTLGATAEFIRTTSEPATVSDCSVITSRGALSLTMEHAESVRVFAWERPSGADLWSQGVALCLPESNASMGSRNAVTELGEDAGAVHASKRGAVLFDLGISARNCDACVRTSDPAVLRMLRAAVGRPLQGSQLLQQLPAASPTRVFLSRLGRIEVDTPIPEPTGRTPDGPHTHFLPALLRSGRTHAADIFVPDGMVPCLEMFPPSAVRDALGNPVPFDQGRFDDFQELLSKYGNAALAGVKAETFAAVRAGKPPVDEPSYSRAQRLARRIALRQLRRIDGPSPALDAWLGQFDRSSRGGDGPTHD